MSQNPRTESVAPGGERPPARIELLAGGTELAQRFEILEVLGTGGYAVVYRAFDRRLAREVALKVLRPDRLSPSALLRLRREAAVARDVVHPRVVRIFDIEEAGEIVFLTMEIVEGGSLGDRLALHSVEHPVAIGDAVAWAKQALEGLAALHALGILHRDIKPGNLLLTRDDEVKLSDFGLALHLDRDETRATTHESVLGTLEYLSPEQALGQPVDARSDLYSIGVVLFEMVAGRMPFVTQSSLGSLLERLRQDETPDLTQLRPETPPWLAAVVRRLLERDPERRYPAAAAVLSDLASRSASSRRYRRTPTRRWIATAALTVVILGAGWGFREWQQSRFSHLLPDGEQAVRAIDAAGRTLWRREAIHQGANFVRTRTALHGDLLAANLVAPGESMSRADSFLYLLDPQSGETIQRLLLPSAHHLFEGFSDTYGASIATVDLDDDGYDELLVSFGHDPYYPSYNVLVEPDRQQADLVFASAGHHRLVGTVDLDGDGRRELLLGGIQNRMGWKGGLAAVRVPPRADAVGAAEVENSMSLAPDLFHGIRSDPSLLWYELLPPPLLFLNGASFEVDSGRRRLLLGRELGNPVAVGFDGFLEDTGHGRPASARETDRRSAYASLRESTRLESAGHPDEAVAVLRAAVAAAEAADDPALLDWAERQLARGMLAAGDRAAALALYESLWSTSPSASEIAYECARGLHAQGQLEPALAWFHRALGKAAAAGYGRNKFEVLQGILFILVEQHRYSEAMAELDRYDAAYPYQQVRAERAFVAWRAGEAPAVASYPLNTSYQDLHLYWLFEIRLLNGESPQRLLDELPAARRVLSGFQPLFDGFEGELLARLGQKEAAASRLSAALREVRVQSVEEPNYRVYLPLLEERTAAVAKGMGAMGRQIR